MLSSRASSHTHRTRPTWALTRIREEPMLFLQSFVSPPPDTSHMSFNKNQRRANAFPPELRLAHRTRPTWALTRIREEPMLFLQSFVSHTGHVPHELNKNQRRANAFPPELRLTHRTRPTWALTRIREEPMPFTPELRLTHRTRPHMSFNRIREEPMLFLQSFVSHTGHVPHELNKNQRRANAFPPELRLTHRTCPTWALTRIREEPMLFLQSFVSHTQDTSHMSFNKNQRRANAFPPELRLAHRTCPTWALTRIREEPMLFLQSFVSHTGHVPHEL